MKRRNADCGKIRRPIKRNKIAEQIGSNTLLYVKFLLLWAFVITADFLLEFRFEYLWPFWLLLRSVYDSFKYKGLAFSVLFVCIAITSDLVCLFFIPMQWLFFAASTYVWVQYVWHTDKGICLPTIILWILFVYLEAAIRWKDSRNIPHLDLCRPFAAHCIGYPVVTLGFGFKSYVGYRIRQRKQREVAKDNDFYMQLLQEALPKDESISSTGTADASASSEHQDHQLSPAQQKELVVSAAIQSGNSNGSISSNTAGGGGGGGGGSGGSNHNHHHHHHSNKNAQSHSKSQVNVTSSTHANGHAGGSTSLSVSNTSPTSSSAMNGGLNHSKHMHRKSLDKESSSSISGKPTSYSYHQQQSLQNNNGGSSAKESTRSTSDSSHANGAATSPKEKKDCDSTGQKSQFDHLSPASSHNNASSSKSAQANDSNHDTGGGGGGGKNKQQQNGHVINCEVEIQQQQQPQPQSSIENDPPAEPKTSRSGRKNRVKQKENANHLAAVRLAATLALASSITTLTTTAAASSTVTSTSTSVTSKDNHMHHSQHEQQQQQQHAAAAGNNTVSNNTQSSGNSNSSTAGSTTVGTVSTATPTTTTVTATQPVITVKVCETCTRLDSDAKRMRAEINNLKQSENEFRQKYESSTNNLKTCLQVKQKDYDELQNKFQDLSAQRQQERQSLQTVERRLGEERRHRQSLESQLQNERKHRKQAEEKAARAECGEPCKLKRQQMDMELQKLRRDLSSSEDAKLNAERQNRNFEQEMRKFEAQLRNRESQQSAEVLMSALAAMQDKNNTLEKNLSAETRVKLDLFSALGDARRQLEITTCSLRAKDKEIIDLKAKMVQLLALMPAMPSDSICQMGPGPSSGGGMRLNDTPQLLPQSPLNGVAGQPSPMSHIVMNSPPLISQLSNLGVLTSTITTSTAAMSSGGTCAPVNVITGGGGMVPPSGQQPAPGVVAVAASAAVAGSNGQIVQMQNSNNCPSNLDPNASVYTPKNCSSMVGGTEA